MIFHLCQRKTVISLLLPALILMLPAAAWSASLRVGVYDNAPMIFTDDQGRARGIIAEVISKIAQDRGFEIEYVPCPFQSCLNLLKDGQIDLLSPVALNPERATSFVFNRENILTNWGQVYAPQDAGIQALTDLEGKTVALLQKDVYTAPFKTTLDTFGIHCLFMETETYSKVMELVSQGKAQAGVVNRFFGQKNASRYQLDTSGVLVHPVQLHLAFRKDIPPKIVAAFDSDIKSMKTDENSVFHNAINTWLSSEPASIQHPDWLVYSVVSAAALILMLGLINFFLQRQVRQKTQTLTQALETQEKVKADLAATLHAITDAVIATDAQGRVTLMNQVAQDLTGWPLDQARGLKVATIFHATDKDGNHPLADPGQPAQKTPESPATLFSRNSRQYQVTHNVSPVLDDDGTIKGFVIVFRDVTDSIRFRESVTQNEAYLRSVLRAAPIGIGVVTDRIFRHVNQKVLEITGYSREEILGQSARIVYPNDEEFNFVGMEKYRQIAQTNTGTVETVWKKKDGALIHVLLSSTPMDRKDLAKGLTFSAMDITQRKEAELALQKSEALYRTLFEKTNDAIFVVQPKTGVFLDANEAAMALAGIRLSDLRQTSIQEITEPYGNQSVQTLLNGSAKSLGEFVFRQPDGSRRIARLNMVHLNEAAAIGIARDVTQDLNMENQLRQAQKMESIGTLAGGIAHDFNNILFPILGFAEMLLEDVEKESSLRHGLDQIYASAIRAKELVGQILAFSRQGRSEPLPMKIQPIIKEALKLIRATIPATIEIRQTIEDHCGVIKADPTQIHQIIINLTTNAYHAMEATGGTLSVSLKRKEIQNLDPLLPSLQLGSYACLSVADTGPGIPLEIQDKIFDPFYTTKEKGKGTGMGLSVVHGIVNRMGGTISVQSAPGQGAVFSLYLPLEEESPDTVPLQGSTDLPLGSEAILVVDDEPEIISMEKQLLERLGYQVTAETSSIKALERFTREPDRFDLVISDVAMPGMAGDQLARSLLRIRPSIPILLCTGFSEIMDEEKALAMGVKGYILKPIVIRTLSEKIRALLDDSGRLQA